MKRQVLLVRRSDLALVRRSDAPDGLVKGNLIKGLMLTSLHSDHIAGLTAGLPSDSAQATSLANNFVIAQAASGSAAGVANTIVNSNHSSSPGPSSSVAFAGLAPSSSAAAASNQAIANTSLVPASALAAASAIVTVPQSLHATLTPSTSTASHNLAATASPSIARHDLNSSINSSNSNNIVVGNNSMAEYPAQLSPTSISSASTVDQQEIHTPISANVAPSGPAITPAAVTTAASSSSTAAAASSAAAAAAAPQAKRPRLTNSRATLTPWKALQYHFQRHTDVKQRPDKKLTMSELSHEGLQRRNGWKVHHLVGQLDDLIDNEFQMRQRLKRLLDSFHNGTSVIVRDIAEKCKQECAAAAATADGDTAADSADATSAATAPDAGGGGSSSSIKGGNSTERPSLPQQLYRQRSYGRNEFDPGLIVTRLDDLLKGNVQRSSLFGDQLTDSKGLIVRITDEHKDRVARITSRSLNKRSYVRERQAS